MAQNEQKEDHMNKRILTWTGLCLVVLLVSAGCFRVGNLRPAASFTATPGRGPTPLTVSLDASASTDPDGTIVQYFWDLGDGQTASLVLPTLVHVYTNMQSDSKVFTAILTVTDDQGAEDTTARNITVDP
jgi:trimeric autotransporter adhesin